MAIKIIFKSS